MKAGAALLIVERKIDTNDLPDHVSVMLVDDAVRALGKLAKAYRRTLTGTKVIGITGTAGKTTTKRLIDAVLSEAMNGSAAPKSFNNHIGVPLTILGADPHDKYLIVEIGSNAPGEIAALAAITEPDIAVITMIGRGHLEKLGSIEDVAQEKAALFQALREGGLVIAHADSLSLRPFIKPLPKCITFGEAPEADLRLTDRGRDGAAWWFEMNGRMRFTTGLPGRHNAINALAAIAVARRFSLADDVIGRGLARVAPEAMRLEPQSVGGIDLYNDAYNANPESVIAALETFAELTAEAGRRFIVLGDMLELGDEAIELHREIGRFVAELDERCRIDRVFTVGELAGEIAEVLGQTWSADRLLSVESVEALTAHGALQGLRRGDAVLIKGSRGMALERLIDELEVRRSEPQSTEKPSRKSKRKRALT